MFGGASIIWASKKQSVVALSTTEAEYVASTECVKELLWVMNLFKEVGIPLLMPWIVYGDNQSCIANTKELRNASRMKHMDLRYHFLKDVVHEGKIKFIYLETKLMAADFLT